MNHRSESEITDAAERLRRLARSRPGPANMQRLCSVARIAHHEVSFRRSIGSEKFVRSIAGLTDGIERAIEFVKGLAGFSIPSQKLVCVDADRSQETVRWTYAHELGHVVLNHNCADQYGVNEDGEPLPMTDATVRSAQEELEADRFAASLLFPVIEFADLRLDLIDANSAKSAAEHFGVSLIAATREVVARSDRVGFAAFISQRPTGMLPPVVRMSRGMRAMFGDGATQVLQSIVLTRAPGDVVASGSIRLLDSRSRSHRLAVSRVVTPRFQVILANLEGNVVLF